MVGVLGSVVVGVGIEVGVFGVAVEWAADVLAALVAEPVVLIWGCAHGIEVRVNALACCPVHVGIEVGVGFCVF